MLNGKVQSKLYIKGMEGEPENVPFIDRFKLHGLFIKCPLYTLICYMQVPFMAGFFGSQNIKLYSFPKFRF